MEEFAKAIAQGLGVGAVLAFVLLAAVKAAQKILDAAIAAFGEAGKAVIVGLGAAGTAVYKLVEVQLDVKRQEIIAAQTLNALLAERINRVEDSMSRLTGDINKHVFGEIRELRRDILRTPITEDIPREDATTVTEVRSSLRGGA